MLQTTRLWGVLITGLAITGATASAADPALLNLVMPDAKVLAGMNATSARISPFGRFILAKIGAARAGAIGQDRTFAELGFNPLQDISEILAASSADPANPGAIVLASGNFPVDKIKSALAGQTNPQVQNYNGATLLIESGKDNKINHAVAFLGTNIAIAGDLASVKAAVDRQTNPSAIDTALALKVKDLSGAKDEWVVSVAPIASLIPANAVQGNAAQGPAGQVLPLLKSIQSFAGGVQLTDTIALSGEAVTSDARNAAALQAVLKLGIALVSSQGANNTQLEDVMKILQSLQVTTNGAAVDLALSIPESQVESLINSAQQLRVKAVAAQGLRQRHSPANVNNGR